MKNFFANIITAIIIIAIVIVIVLGFALLLNDFELDATSVTISAIVVGGVIVWGFIKTKDSREKAKAEQAKKDHEEQELRRYQASVRTGDIWAVQRFYNECVKEGIKDVNKESNRARLELYAQNKEIEGTKEELVAAFRKGQAAVTQLDTTSRINKLRMEEKTISDENRRYISQHGREKRIAICQDMIRECERKIAECESQFKKINSAASDVYNGYKQKEGDWAVLGGMATGIAGGAAGVATAIDVQQRNAEKRAYNQQLGSAVGQLAANSLMQISKEKINAENEKKTWEQNLERAKRALFEDLPSDTLMSCLDLRVDQKKKSETGAIRLKVNVKQNKGVFIYGDASAVVDGSIQVLIVADDKTVAKGIITFPYSGSSTYGKDFDIICNNSADVPNTYSVRFEPNNIWAIEEL